MREAIDFEPGFTARGGNPDARGLGIDQKEQLEVFQKLRAETRDTSGFLAPLIISEDQPRSEKSKRAELPRPENAAEEPIDLPAGITQLDVRMAARIISSEESLGQEHMRQKIQEMFEIALKSGSPGVKALEDAINQELEGTGFSLSGQASSKYSIIQKDVGNDLIVPPTAAAHVYSLTVTLNKDGVGVEDHLDFENYIEPPYDDGKWSYVRPFQSGDRLPKT